MELCTLLATKSGSIRVGKKYLPALQLRIAQITVHHPFHIAALIREKNKIRINKYMGFITFIEKLSMNK